MNGSFHLGTISKLCGTTALVAAATLFAAHSGAYAQEVQSEEEEAELGLEEIVVTARRRSELMQDIPLSMVVLGRLELDRAGYESLADVALGVPNFSFVDSGSILGDFGMRGIATDADNPGFESALAVYVDGVLVGRPEGFDTALQGIGQVEVLRGPQGTLFGKNTIAGALNITTQRPSEELAGSIEIEAGRFERGMVSGWLNLPIVGDKLMARVSMAVTREDGWIKNLFDDRKFNGEDSWSGRAQLLFQPTEKLEIYASMDRFYDNRTSIGGINDDPDSLKDNPDIKPLKGVIDIDSPSTSRRNLWGGLVEINYTTDAGYTFTSLTGFRKTAFNSRRDNDSQRQRLSEFNGSDSTDQWTEEIRVTSPELDIFGGKLDFVAGAFLFTQDIDGDGVAEFFPKDILAGCTVAVTPGTFRGFPPPPPFEPTVRIAGFNDQGLPIWDFDINSNGIFNEPGEAIGCHNPDLIAFGRHIPGGDAMDLVVIGDPALGFDSALTAADVPETSGVRRFGEVNTNSYALFGQANYHFTDRLTLTGGVRHTWEDKNLDLTQQGLINISRPSFTKKDSRSDNEFSGMAALTFTWSENIMLYAKYAHGFKSGGFQFSITQGENVTAFAAMARRFRPAAGETKAEFIDRLIAASADPNEAPDNVEFGTENVNVFELGFKTTLLDGRVRFNASGFFTDYNDFQSSVPDVRIGIVALNIPEAEIWGFETDITAMLYPGLTINGGVGAAFSEITKALIVPDPDGGPDIINSSNLLGLRLPVAPEWTANAAITYAVPVTPTGSLVIRGEWNHVGSIFHDLVADQAGRVKEFEPSYNLFNARIGYVDDEDDWEFFLWGKNLGNETYAAFRTQQAIIRNFGLRPDGSGLAFPGTGTAQVTPGKVRTWGVTLRKGF